MLKNYNKNYDNKETYQKFIVGYNYLTFAQYTALFAQTNYLMNESKTEHHKKRLQLFSVLAVCNCFDIFKIKNRFSLLIGYIVARYKCPSNSKHYFEFKYSKKARALKR